MDYPQNLSESDRYWFELICQCRASGKSDHQWLTKRALKSIFERSSVVSSKILRLMIQNTQKKWRMKEAAHRILIELINLFGEYKDDLRIVGGWVPDLMFPNQEHIGSVDVRICFLGLENQFQLLLMNWKNLLKR